VASQVAGHGTAQQARAGDDFQRPLRSRFQPRLTRGVDMICIANDGAKRAFETGFWRNRCPNRQTS